MCRTLRFRSPWPPSERPHGGPPLRYPALPPLYTLHPKQSIERLSAPPPPGDTHLRRNSLCCGEPAGGESRDRIDERKKKGGRARRQVEREYIKTGTKPHRAGGRSHPLCLFWFCFPSFPTTAWVSSSPRSEERQGPSTAWPAPPRRGLLLRKPLKRGWHVLLPLEWYALITSSSSP